MKVADLRAACAMDHHGMFHLCFNEGFDPSGFALFYICAFYIVTSFTIKVRLLTQNKVYIIYSIFIFSITNNAKTFPIASAFRIKAPVMVTHQRAFILKWRSELTSIISLQR